MLARAAGKLLQCSYRLIVINFSQEWTDYDEKANTPVSVFEVQHKFVKL